MTDTIAQLVARVEAAKGPDRDLDARILCGERGDDFDLMARVVPDFGEWYPLPAYTASLDAAMTLRPPDTFCGYLGDDYSGFEACCQHAGPDKKPPELRWIKGSTPALALVAACLRAHDGGSNGN